MKSKVAIIAPASKILTFYFMAQHQGSDQLLSDFTLAQFTTSSNPAFELLYTTQYTIDTFGTIEVNDIDIDLFLLSDANSEFIMQISGDGGTTFAPVTTALQSGITEITGGGLWISHIQPGNDKLVIQLLGRSLDGNPATIGIFIDSFIRFVLFKTNFI